MIVNHKKYSHWNDECQLKWKMLAYTFSSSKPIIIIAVARTMLFAFFCFAFHAMEISFNAQRPKNIRNDPTFSSSSRYHFSMKFRNGILICAHRSHPVTVTHSCFQFRYQLTPFTLLLWYNQIDTHRICLGYFPSASQSLEQCVFSIHNDAVSKGNFNNKEASVIHSFSFFFFYCPFTQLRQHFRFHYDPSIMRQCSSFVCSQPYNVISLLPQNSLYSWHRFFRCEGPPNK